MLHEFIDLNRDVIISRTRDRVRQPAVAVCGATSAKR